MRQSSDWLARYGGEEFAIVLPQTDAEGAIAVAEKVRAASAGAPFNTSVGPLAVTVSLGVAPLTESLQTTAAMADLLSRADAALYKAKQTGRNRVAVVELQNERN